MNAHSAKRLPCRSPPCERRILWDGLVCGNQPLERGKWLQRCLGYSAICQILSQDVELHRVAAVTWDCGIMRREWPTLRACATLTLLLVGLTTVVPSAWSGTQGRGIDDLPLIELPGPRSDSTLVLFLSGDGGWRDLDKTIGERLASEGLQVVGFDSLRYFWHARSADELAHDLARSLNHYRTIWGSKRFVLAGYSFGADVLPAALERMETGLRNDVIKVVLLGLSDQASFEIHPTEWLGIPAAGTPILPDARKLDMTRVLCIFGREEKRSLCRDPAFTAAERIETAGGHHFDGNYEGLASRILASIRRTEGL